LAEVMTIVSRTVPAASPVMFTLADTAFGVVPEA